MNGLFVLLITIAAVTANVIQLLDQKDCEPNPKCVRPSNDSSPVIHLPYEPDCHKFYKCSYGEACLWDCPSYDGSNRLVFNPKEQVCDWPWNVPGLPNCSDTDSPSDSDKTTTSTAKTTTTTKDDGIITRRKRDATQHVQCPNEDVRISHESNCNYFYECHNGISTLKKCGEGLVFNPFLETCDFPFNYKCSSTD